MNQWRKPKRGLPAGNRNPLDELGIRSQPFVWLLNDLKSESPRLSMRILWKIKLHNVI